MKEPPIKRHIFLNGFMGAGKSKIGPILARQLTCDFYDTDKIIEEACGKRIFDIFNEDGEADFRKKEQAVIFQLIAQSDFSVIALGGGAFMDELTRKKAEQSGIIIYLKSSPQSIYDRVKNTSKRPLLQIEPDENYESNLLKKITELLTERRTIYESAHIIIDRDGLEPEQVAEKILEQVNEREKH